MLGLSVGVGTGVVHARAGLASLNLDLTAANVDSRISFTRATSKTFLGSNGYIQTAGSGVWPVEYDINGVALGRRVDEQRTNLVTYSEEFDSLWFSSNVAIINAPIIAPDGSAGAKLAIVRSTGGSTFSRSVTSAGSASGNTYSLYAKKGSGATDGNKFGLRNATTATNLVMFDVNLDTGGITYTVGSSGASVVDAGNGWWKISISVTSGISAGDTLTVYAGHRGGAETAGEFAYLWGAQLEAGLFPSPYIPTTPTFTSRASDATYTDSSGVIQTAGTDVARTGFLNIGGTYYSQGLVLEAAGTNLLLRSEDFATTWTLTGTGSVTSGADTSSGISLDLLDTTDTAVLGNWSQTVTFTGDGEKCFSIFLKAGTAAKTTVKLRSVGVADRGRFVVDWSGGVPTATSNLGTLYPVEQLTNGVYRFRCSAPGIVAAETNSLQVYPASDTNVALTGTVYAGGAQVENAVVPSSYIPTAAATVTRSADVSSSSSATRNADQASMTGTNFSSWYNASEGTVFVKAVVNVGTGGNYLYSISDGTTSNAIYGFMAASGSARVRALYVDTSGSSQVAFAPTSTLGSFSFAARYKINDFAVSVSGATPLTDTNGLIPVVSVLHIGMNQTGLIGQTNGIIKTIRYYPVALPDATLQTLTS